VSLPHDQRALRHHRSSLGGAGHRPDQSFSRPDPHGRRGPRRRLLDSVASAFKGNGSVIFDLYNEPNITDWSCWVSGAAASANCAQANGSAYAVAGMATMLQAVRTAGAPNIAILGGLAYSQDFSKWVTSVQSIPSLPAPLDGISIDNVAASCTPTTSIRPIRSAHLSTTSLRTALKSCATAQQFATSSGITGVSPPGFRS